MEPTGNANMLRIARQLRGFQQGEAATRLGISQAVLSRLENQLVGLSDEVLDRAAAAYELPR